jgi:hypothetical protein
VIEKEIEKQNRRISNVECPSTSAEAATAHTRRRMLKGRGHGSDFVIQYSLFDPSSVAARRLSDQRISAMMRYGDLLRA